MQGGRNRSLDGVRGLAVFMVILNHHGLFNFGWTGVDLFFVLSGFLITSKLRSSCCDEHYWSEFWVKRLTRILPPILIALLLVAILFRPPTLLLLSPLFTLAGLWAVALTQFEVVTIMWSLSVEEHYYFAWPFLVRFIPERRKLMLLLGTLLLAEPAIRAIVYLVWHPSWRLFYFLTPFRLDGIALGSWLALAIETASGQAIVRRRSLGMLVAASMLYAVLRLGLGGSFSTRGNSFAFDVFVYTVVACIAGAAVGYLLTHQSSLGVRILAAKPLAMLGEISYGIYVYQLIVREVLLEATHLPVKRLAPLSVAVTLGLAYLSFRFIERPIVVWGKKKAATFRAEALSVPHSQYSL